MIWFVIHTTYVYSYTAKKVFKHIKLNIMVHTFQTSIRSVRNLSSVCLHLSQLLAGRLASLFEQIGPRYEPPDCFVNCWNDK